MSHCVVISADFLYVSYFLPFPLTMVYKKLFILRNLLKIRQQLQADLCEFEPSQVYKSKYRKCYQTTKKTIKKKNKKKKKKK